MMKNVGYLIVFLTIVIMTCLFSCKHERAYEKSMKDSIVINVDSLKRDSIFSARGDTIFANVLYGMNKNEAIISINEFQNKFKESDNSGFRFANIRFMDIDFHDIDIYDDFFINQSIDDHWGAEFWDGKLSAVTWTSYNYYEKNLAEIEPNVASFIQFLELKFGPANINRANPTHWHYYDINDNKEKLIRDNDMAVWETQKCKIIVLMKGLKYDPYQNYPYQYHLCVSFFDKKYLIDSDSIREVMREERKRHIEEQRRKDSTEYINAL